MKNSESLEMYLETMYRLESEVGKIRCVDIANSLHVSKPSVNKAVNVLKISAPENTEEINDAE